MGLWIFLQMLIMMFICKSVEQKNDKCSMRCYATTLHNNVHIYITIYKFQRLRDANQFYIGKTKRHLVTRVGEHKYANSAVYDHLNGCQFYNDRFSVDLFKILDLGRSAVETTIKEALYIKAHKLMLYKVLRAALSLEISSGLYC